MYVYNNFTHDSRVLKEAKSLIEHGFQVTVIAFLDAATVPREIREGIEVIRVPRDPPHLRIIRSRSPLQALWFALSLIRFMILFPFLLLQLVLKRGRKRAGRSLGGLGLWRIRLVYRRWVRRPLKLLRLGTARLFHRYVIRSLYLARRRTGARCNQLILRPTRQAYRRLRRVLRLKVVRPLARGQRLSRSWAVKRFSPIRRRLLRRYRLIRSGTARIVRLRIRRPLYLAGKAIRKRLWLSVLRPCYLLFYRLRRAYRIRLRRPLILVKKRLQSRWRGAVERPLARARKRLVKDWNRLAKAWKQRLVPAMFRPFQGLKALLNRPFNLPVWRRQPRARRALFQWARWSRLQKKSLRWWNGWQRTVRNRTYSSLRVILMPFHRQFCYADFYQQVYETQGGVRADFYHAHDLNTLPLAFAMARRHGAKLVYDSHELYLDRNRFRPLSFFGRLFVQRIEAFLIRRCDGVITVNESIAEILRDRYSIPLPTVVMNTPFRCDSSIDPGSRSLRSCLPIRSDHRILLYSGGITFNRGLDKLIRSLVLLPDCHLIMMGYGAEAFVQELAELAEHEKVADRLSFFGPVPSEEVSLYAASADLGVAPIENACLSYYYCSPNKLFEYIHAGLPVIASNFPEMCRVIDRHQIGEAFDPSDPADIARSVKKILDQPEKLPRLRENSRQAAAFYNWEIESKRLLKLYRDLLGPSQAAPRLALLAQRSSSPAEPHPRPSQLTGPHTLPAPAPPAPGRRVG